MLHEIELVETYSGMVDSLLSGETYVDVLNLVHKSETESLTPTDNKLIEQLPLTHEQLADTYSTMSDGLLSGEDYVEQLTLVHEQPTEIYSGMTDGILNTTGGTIHKELVDTYSGMSDDKLMEPLDVPEIYYSIPDGNTYSFLSTFAFKAYGTASLTYDIELYDNSSPTKVVIKSWSGTMTSIGQVGGRNAQEASYKMDMYVDDFLMPGNYNVLFKCSNDEYTIEKWNAFSVLDADTEVTCTDITKNFTKNQLIFTFRIRNLNERWINLYPLLVTDSINKELEITSVLPTDCVVIKDDKWLLIKTDGEYQDIVVYTTYTTPVELTQKANALNKSTIKVGYKIEIWDIDDNYFDVTRWVKNISHSKDTELDSAQADITFHLDSALSPFTNVDTPLFYGNKIKITSILDKDSVYESNTEYIGYITNVDTTDNDIKISALDKLKKFNNRLAEDLRYTPDLIEMTEVLKSLDGVKFESAHKAWAELPSPKVYLKGEIMKPGEYLVDYYRGRIYLQKNPYLSPIWYDSTFLAENITDRKTIELEGELNICSSVTIKHFYEEKTLYSCVGGVGEQDVWIQKTVLLVNTIDYIVDYEESDIILTNALPENTSSIRNHGIEVSWRKDIGEVKAIYSYYVPNTNLVEDIIGELAQKVGFSTSDFSDSVTLETIYSRDGYTFQCSKKNITTINYLKVNGTPYTDYHSYDKIGVINMGGLYPTSEIMIDPIISTSRFQTNGSNLSLSTDRYLDDTINRSVSVDMPAGGWILKKYHYEGITLDMSMFEKIAIYLKADSDQSITIELLDSDDFTILGTFTGNITANTWSKIEMDVSGIDDRDSIGDIRIYASNCNLKIDYLHVPSNVITISYEYNTLQPTEVDINDVWFMREEVDSYTDILEQLFKQVEPSYSLYIDNNEKLRAEYRKIPLYYILPAVYNVGGLENDVAFGTFLLPDYTMYLLNNFSNSIGEDQVYTAVQVIGKLSERANVALSATASDECAVVGGTNYNKTPKTDYRNKWVRAAEQGKGWELLLGIISVQDLDPTAYSDGNANIILDGNVTTGISWYIKKDNDATRPFTNEQHMVTINLDSAIYWEEIVICVGAYKNKVIREEIYIEVEDESGNKYFPEGEYQQKKQGQTGTHLRWNNSRFKNIKIAKVYIYCAEAWRWITSTSISGGGKK